jgi:hypothetical protein
MKKFFRRVVKTFKKLADANFLAFGRNVTSSMAAAVDDFPTPVPSLVSINEELDNFDALMTSAKNRDKIQVWLKNQSRLNLLMMLSQLANYVNATTTDAVVLAKSGFPLNKIPEPVQLEAPTHLVLTDGLNSGELILKFKKPKGAISYVHRYSTDPLLAPESWVSFAATTTSYTFTGLNKGTLYYVQAVSVGSKNQRVASIVVNRVSQ